MMNVPIFKVYREKGFVPLCFFLSNHSFWRDWTEQADTGRSSRALGLHSMAHKCLALLSFQHTNLATRM